MAVLDASLLRRFEYLSLLARRSGGRSLAAGPRGATSAEGIEVAGLRDYAPGDDYRHVDWNWCARRDELLTRIYSGRCDVSVYVLLDCSASMGLGKRAKFDLARRTAALLGYMAAARLNRLQVTAFSEGIVAESAPVRHKADMAGLFRFLEQLTLQATRTDLGRSAEGFARRYQPHGPVVVISDLYDQAGFQGGLDLLLSRGYEPRVVQICDPREADPQCRGDVELFDVEAETTQRATITEADLRRYRELFLEFHESVRSYCAGRGLRRVQLPSDVPEEEADLTVLGLSERETSGN